MFTDRGRKILRQLSAACFVGAAVFGIQAATPFASADEAKITPARLIASPQAPSSLESEARTAAATFVWGLSNGHAEVVWQFATEEEQEAFATEAETYNVFVSAYPPLAYAKEMTFEGVTPDGGLQIVSIYVKDRLDLQWRASFGLWKDDAGDWKVMTLDIEPAPGELV